MEEENSEDGTTDHHAFVDLSTPIRLPRIYHREPEALSRTSNGNCVHLRVLKHSVTLNQHVFELR
jgi:hypothetical protein